MTRRTTLPTLYDIALTTLNGTRRHRPDGKPVDPAAWNRAVAAAIEAAAEAGGVTVRPDAAGPPPAVRQRPADEWDVAACAEILEVDLPVLLSKAMDTAIAEARHIVFYVLHESTETSYAAVGRLMGRNHSAVRYGCGLIEKRADRDPQIRAWVRACTAAVLCAPAVRAVPA